MPRGFPKAAHPELYGKKPKRTKHVLKQEAKTPEPNPAQQKEPPRLERRYPYGTVGRTVELLLRFDPLQKLGFAVPEEHSLLAVYQDGNGKVWIDLESTEKRS